MVYLAPCGAAHGACWTVPAPNLKGLKFRLEKSKIHRFDPVGSSAQPSRSTFAYAKIGETTPLRVGALRLGTRWFGTWKNLRTWALAYYLYSWVDDGRWCLEFLPGGSLFSDMLLDSVDPFFVAWKAPWNGPKECGEQDQKSQSKHSPLRKKLVLGEWTQQDSSPHRPTGARISAALLSPLCFGALSWQSGQGVYLLAMENPPFLMGKSPFLMGKSTIFNGKSTIFNGKSPFLMSLDFCSYFGECWNTISPCPGQKNSQWLSVDHPQFYSSRFAGHYTLW